MKMRFWVLCYLHVYCYVFVILFVYYPDTTDVQSVQVVEMNVMGVVKIQCNFLTGSDSGGCVVMLEGENIDNATIVLTRENDRQDVVITHLLSHPLSCYFHVFAFDIESDGSIGVLPVPGMLQNVKHVAAQHCLTPPNEENSQTGKYCRILFTPTTLIYEFLHTLHCLFPNNI